MMHLGVSELFRYKAPNGVPSKCFVDTFRKGHTLYVVFTEPNEPSGMSVTNAIETVIRNYHNERIDDWDFDNIRWFERYVHPNEQTLDEVKIDSDYENPRWKRVVDSPFSFSY